MSGNGNGSVRSVFMHGGESGVPDRQIAIIDGEPQVVANLPMIAEMIKTGPMGVDAGFRAVVEAIGHNDELHALVYEEAGR